MFQDFPEEENGYPTCSLRHQDFQRDTILDVILTELIAEVVDTGLVDHE